AKAGFAPYSPAIHCRVKEYSMRTLIRVSFLLALPAFVVGCGGSGSSSGNGGGSASTGGSSRAVPVALFATDSPREDFDHVWITINKIDLVDQSGGVQTVYDDPTGETIDLR